LKSGSSIWAKTQVIAVSTSAPSLSTHQWDIIRLHGQMKKEWIS
jgi:hypothetical protein